MNDQLRKLISISEASEDSCEKALAMAGDDFVKAIKLAIYLAIVCDYFQISW